jgi:hypothetical protein
MHIYGTPEQDIHAECVIALETVLPTRPILEAMSEAQVEGILVRGYQIVAVKKIKS